MTEKLKTDAKLIRAMISETYQTCGKLLASLETSKPSPASIAKNIDAMSAQFERGTVFMRNLCEHSRPNELISLGKKPLPDISIAGKAEVSRYGWVHIQLNTLLPHCRFQTPAYLTDTIIRLLNEYEEGGKILPRFDTALLVIDEHCNINSRTVFDQDNKDWKAIPNAIKGRLVRDDDQFTLEIALLSTFSDTVGCHIHILPQEAAGDFFLLRNDERF